jgi:hypothetical protein
MLYEWHHQLIGCIVNTTNVKKKTNIIDHYNGDGNSVADSVFWGCMILKYYNEIIKKNRISLDVTRTTCNYYNNIILYIGSSETLVARVGS